MNVFGPPLATHGPNRIVVGIFAVLAAGALWLVWLDLHRTGQDKSEGPGDAVIHLAFALALAALAFWGSRQRLVLYPEGLSYSNLLGDKQVRWDDILFFYYGATRRSVNFIPIGTYYSFRLQDSRGQKIRFGSDLAHAAALAERLVQLTQGPLLKRIAQQFDSGADVEFGSIRLNRQTGIRIKGSFGRTRQIPWSEVHSYAITGGRFYIWRVGEKRTTGLPVAKVPNAFALLSLLDIVLKSPQPAARN